ncbi:MAG: DsbA family protein [Gemmatimonadetes bacterium]|nr:DsbA family protein [Gemmatimonadota bacterium]
MAKKTRQAASGGSEMKKFYWILGIVAVVAIGVVGYSIGTSAIGSAVAEPVDVEGLDDPTRLVELAQGVTMGDPDAPITIIEFGDYQCPGCGAFAQQVKPQIEFAYVEPGTARFVYYDYPIINAHPQAFLAARAARCAGDQDRYWDYHTVLFQNQGRWSGSGNAAGAFISYAEELALDADAFEACLRSDRHADVVTANMRLGQELGVPGTPTVMVSRGQGMARRVSGNSFQAIQDAVESLQQPQGEGGER